MSSSLSSAVEEVKAEFSRLALPSFFSKGNVPTITFAETLLILRQQGFLLTMNGLKATVLPHLDSIDIRGEEVEESQMISIYEWCASAENNAVSRVPRDQRQQEEEGRRIFKILDQKSEGFIPRDTFTELMTTGGDEPMRMDHLEHHLNQVLRPPEKTKINLADFLKLISIPFPPSPASTRDKDGGSSNTTTAKDASTRPSQPLTTSSSQNNNSVAIMVQIDGCSNLIDRSAFIKANSPFVKVLDTGNGKEIFKNSPMTFTQDPKWQRNKSTFMMMFDTRENKKLAFEVWSWSSISTNEFYGVAYVSADELIAKMGSGGRCVFDLTPREKEDDPLILKSKGSLGNITLVVTTKP